MSTKSQKRKTFYKSNQPFKRSKRGEALSPGMKGFLCTCNKRERECIREAYNILDEYSAKLYPQKETREEEEKVEDELAKELEELKNEKKEKQFQVVDTGANSCVFIKTTLDNPAELVEEIMRDVSSEKKSKSKFLMKLIPITTTCKAYIEDITKTADKMFDDYFKGEPTTFSIMYNKRYNNSVLRDEVISAIALLVKDRNQNHKVDLKQSKKTIIIEIIKAVCGISVVDNFFEYRKFNLLELGKGENSGGENVGKSEEEKVENSEEEKQQNSEKEKEGNLEKEKEGDSEREKEETNPD